MRDLNIPSVAEIGFLKGKRVLVRVDFNVPLADRHVTSDYRIKAMLPTIEHLRKAGAKVILLSHLDGKGGRDLMPVSIHIKKILPHTYIPDTNMIVIGEHVAAMQNGDVTLLANIRYWRGEEVADEQFAFDFCKMFDLYVNEAFSVSHREHASVVLFPKYLPSCAGIRFLQEIKVLSKAFEPEHPFLFVLSGAKFGTKQPLISKFMDIADEVFVGGAIANDFFAQQGYEVGKSLIAKPPITIPEQILGSPKLLLPKDVTVKTTDGTTAIKKSDEIAKEDEVVDVGPETVSMLRAKAEKAKLIIWNGPLGIYEQGFVTQTEELAIAVAEAVGVSIVGGGDTIAAIARLQMENTFDFVSTGGGAMLEFLVKETLPGIEALQPKK